MRVLTGLFIVLLIAACQDKPTVISDVDETNVTTATNNKSEVASSLACVNKNTIKKSPPIQDKSKIKAMLLKSGKITPQMTPAQADKIVNDFIRAKQNPKKNCK